MATMPTTTRMTAADLIDLPDDGQRYDLVRGELIGMPPAAAQHGKYGGRIGVFLGRFVMENDLGVVFGSETGFLLTRDPDTVLAPDAAFVRADRLPPEETWSGYLELAPDLVVEVVSPSDRAGQIHDKILLYLEAGVRLLWSLDPRRKTVTVHTPDGLARILKIGDTLDGGDVLPGFRLPLADLFA